MADVAVHTAITDRVAVLTLSHPARRNAINIDSPRCSPRRCRRRRTTRSVGAIVVTGEDPAFCAGGDLAELATAGRPRHAQDRLRRVPRARRLPAADDRRRERGRRRRRAQPGARLRPAPRRAARQVRRPLPAARPAPRRRLHVDGPARPRPAGRRRDDAVRRGRRRRRGRTRSGWCTGSSTTSSPRPWRWRARAAAAPARPRSSPRRRTMRADRGHGVAGRRRRGRGAGPGRVGALGASSSSGWRRCRPGSADRGNGRSAERNARCDGRAGSERHSRARGELTSQVSTSPTGTEESTST